MAIRLLAGKPAPKELLIDPEKLAREYFENRPDPADPNQLVSFGTSGHRGTASNSTFTEWHILAITQAICDYRRARNITGPVFLAKDTHALSRVAQQTALEVLAAMGVTTRIQREDGFTPTPVVSRAILEYNRGRTDGLADGAHGKDAVHNATEAHPLRRCWPPRTPTISCIATELAAPDVELCRPR